jgi:hypothetical protein
MVYWYVKFGETTLNNITNRLCISMQINNNSKIAQIAINEAGIAFGKA